MVILRIQKTAYYWNWDSSRKLYRLVSESDLAKAIPGYRELNERARSKKFQKYVKESEVTDCGRMPENLPNTRHFRGPDGRRRPPTQEELKAGAEALLALETLFPEVAPGWELPADLLTGLWCTALRKAEPGLRPVTTVPLDTPALQEVFKLLVKTAVPRKKWRRGKFRLKRIAVLRYQTRPGAMPRHIQDYTELKRKSPAVSRCASQLFTTIRWSDHRGQRRAAAGGGAVHGRGRGFPDGLRGE